MNTLALLGDSTFARLNRVGDNGFLHLFKETFPNIKLLDISSSGANVISGFTQLTNTNLESEIPVFVMFGTNDSASWKKVPIEEFESTYEEIIERILSTNNKIILITPPAVNTKKQTPPGRSNEELKIYSEVVRSLVEKYEIGLIDLNMITSENMKLQDIHCDDGVHMNDAGYRILLKEMRSVM